MKKIIMTLAIIAGMVATASVDVYSFKSKINVYSLSKKAYVSTQLNGDLTVDTDAGTAKIEATKKDTNENVTLTCTADNVFAIITGKRTTVGAMYGSAFTADDDSLWINIAGNGTAKTVTTGCGPCGGSTSCTKIKTLKGALIGAYDCGCANGQHYVYDGSCELPAETETTVCPIWGTWQATLKTVDGAKYK